MTAISTIDEDTFIGAEHSCNLFTLRKNGGRRTIPACLRACSHLADKHRCCVCAEATTEEEKRRLEVVGLFHVGEFVNAFRPGSLVMQLPHQDAGAVPAPAIDGAAGGGAMDLDQAPEGEAAASAAPAAGGEPKAKAPLLFASVNGAIGVVAQLPPSVPKQPALREARH